MSDKQITQEMVDKQSAENNLLYKQLQDATNGNMPMDTSDARRELFFDKLVEWGIVLPSQRLEYEYEFHLKVAESLDQAWVQVRRVQAQAKAQKSGLQAVRRPTTLLGADGAPIRKG